MVPGEILDTILPLAIFRLVEFLHYLGALQFGFGEVRVDILPQIPSATVFHNLIAQDSTGRAHCGA